MIKFTKNLKMNKYSDLTIKNIRKNKMTEILYNAQEHQETYNAIKEEIERLQKEENLRKKTIKERTP